MIANGRNLIFDLATRRVADYARPQSRSSIAADEVEECQQSLAAGLDAIRWLHRADETMRQADYDGIFQYSEHLQTSIKGLLADWLQKAKSVAAAAENLEVRGTRIPDLALFRRTLGEVQELVDSGELSQLAGESAFGGEPW